MPRRIEDSGEIVALEDGGYCSVKWDSDGEVTSIPMNGLYPEVWRLCAHEYLERDGSGTYFMHIGSRSYVRMHMLNEVIVEIELIEDPDGRYWGWLDKDGRVPTMIWPNENQFRVCFPYGPEAEQKRGRGRIVRMRAQKVV